jgi:hypothetical protein
MLARCSGPPEPRPWGARSRIAFAGAALASMLSLRCSDAPRIVSDTSSSGAMGSSASTEPDTPPRELCGAPGEACCRPPLPVCGLGAACQSSDAGAGICVAQPADTAVIPLCRSDWECPSGSTCCVSGAFGRCVQTNGAECPAPDLALAGSSAPGARPRVTTLFVSPDRCSLDEDCECLVEKGCAFGTGARRMLHVDALPLNIGGADLLLGNPESSPLYSRDSCSQRPFLDDYLRYELLEESGAVILRHDSRLVPRCRASNERGPLEGPFRCEQQGLAHGLARSFTPDGFRLDESSTFGVNDCPYIDITEVPPGRYEVRVTINPEGVIAESRGDNNSWSFRIQIPTFDDPARPCPDESSLLYRSEPPECGWTRAALADPTCTPGARVQFECDNCGGAPVARVCPGDAACSQLEALPTEPSRSSSCLQLAFTCPDTGRYGVLLSSGIFDEGQQRPTPEPFRCDPAP